MPLIRSTSPPAAKALAPVAVLTTAVLAWLEWNHWSGGIWIDSDVYVLGARALLHGSDLYSGVTAAELRFTYPPFAAAAFVPLALLPATVARWALTLLSLAALATTILVVGRRLRLNRWAMAWLAVASVALEPVFRNFVLGQINLVLMALIVVDLLVLPRRYRGLLVGIAAGIKLTPAVFVVYLLLRKDWASATRVAVGFMATLAIGLALSWSSSLSYWGGGFAGLGKFGAQLIVGTHNQSLYAAALRVFGRPDLPVAVQFLLASGGVGLGALAARRSLASGRLDSDVEAIAWIALGGLLASPISWTHHWVWMIVVLAVLASRKERVRAALILLVFWFPTVWMLYTGDNLQSLHFPWWKALLSLVYVIAGLWLLLDAATRGNRSPSAGPTAMRARPDQENERPVKASAR